MSETQVPKVSNLNLPNILTSLRILMVPFFGWALLHDGGDSILWRSVAFGLFVAAMITDKVDGDIARARNLVTNFGKIADPIADKAITGMAFIALSQVVIAASQSGKIKTTLQAIALSGLCLPLPHGGAHGGAFDRFGTVGEVLFYTSQVFLAGAVAMTLWSGYEFFRDVWRQRHLLRG